MDISKDPKFEYFLKDKPRAENTKRRYTRDLRPYAECLNKTPTELIQEARKEQKEYE